MAEATVSDGAVDCRLGKDAIGQLGGYAVSFRDMVLLPLGGQ